MAIKMWRPEPPAPPSVQVFNFPLTEDMDDTLANYYLPRVSYYEQRPIWRYFDISGWISYRKSNMDAETPYYVQYWVKVEWYTPVTPWVTSVQLPWSPWWRITYNYDSWFSAESINTFEYMPAENEYVGIQPPTQPLGASRHFICMWYSQTDQKVRCYIDWQLVAEDDSATAYANYDGSGLFWWNIEILLSDFQWWTEPRTDQQILDYYNQTKNIYQ